MPKPSTHNAEDTELILGCLHRLEGKLDTIIDRIGQLKTRDADEEREDQKAKARARYARKKAGV